MVDKPEFIGNYRILSLLLERSSYAMYLAEHTSQYMLPAALVLWKNISLVTFQENDVFHQVVSALKYMPIEEYDPLNPGSGRMIGTAMIQNQDAFTGGATPVGYTYVLQSNIDEAATSLEKQLATDLDRRP